MSTWLLVLIIAAAVFSLILGIFYLLFCVAFVRRRNTTGDIDSRQNAFLGKYKETIRKGMMYADSLPKTEISVKSYDGLTLVGDYYKNGNSKDTIILFHGYRSASKRDFSCAIEMYYNMGLNVLLVDQRSHGRSSGKLITFGVKERYDVKSWVEYVIKNYGEDTNIILDGLSMGATTVLLSTELELPENVKCIIADCGFSSPYEIIKRVSAKSYHVDSEAVLRILDLYCRILGSFSIYNISTVEAMKKNSIPVFFCHGKADDFVPCDMSQRAYDAAICEKNIHLAENAGHGMSFLTEPDILTCELQEFIKTHIA